MASSKANARKAPPAAPAPEEVARAVFAAIAGKELDRIVPYLHDDVVDDFVAVGTFRGPAEIRGFFDEIFRAFPDFELEVLRIVADDRAAAVQWRARGTFTGAPFQGIQATGRRVEIPGADVMEIEDGRIRHNTIYYDGASFARAVGLLPRRDSAVDRGMLSSFNAVTRLRSKLRG